MKHFWLFFLGYTIFFSAKGQSKNAESTTPYISKVWVSDQGDGTYKTRFCTPTTPTQMSAGWVTIIT